MAHFVFLINDKNNIFNIFNKENEVLKEKFCWFSVLSLKQIPHSGDSRETLDRAQVKHVQKLSTFFQKRGFNMAKKWLLT